MKFIRILFVVALASCFVTRGSISIAQSDFSSPSVLTDLSNYCDGHDFFNDVEEARLCWGTFYCGDGGCIPNKFVALIYTEKIRDFRKMAAGLSIESYEDCGADWEYEDQIFTHPYLNLVRSKIEGRSFKVFCGETTPGYDVETVLKFRQSESVVLEAIRIGGGAGIPSLSLIISADQFFAFRGTGIAALRPHVVDAIEVATGVTCETTQRVTCSVVPARGKITVDLLTPGSVASGRSSTWERSYWEIFPTQQFAGDFELSINLPITSLRTWPTDRAKPTSGFVPLDFDQGFEQLQGAAASRLVDSLNADFPPWY